MIINPLTQKSISQVIINFKEQSLFCLLVSDFLDPTQNSKLCNLHRYYVSMQNIKLILFLKIMSGLFLEFYLFIS